LSLGLAPKLALTVVLVVGCVGDPRDTGVPLEPETEGGPSSAPPASPAPTGHLDEGADFHHPPRPREPGDLVVLVTNAEQKFTGVEVVCPSGLRNHEPLAVDRAHFHGFAPEACNLRFKGGGPAALFGPVTSGQVLRCSFESGTPECTPIDDVEVGPEEVADLVVTLSPEQSFNNVGVECSSGFHQEHPAEAGALTFRDVPVAACVLIFRGQGSPERHHPVSGGQTLACDFEGRKPICR